MRKSAKETRRVQASIANLADFAALDPFFRIIDQSLDGLVEPGSRTGLIAREQGNLR
jgi:hypothetical protein